MYRSSVVRIFAITAVSLLLAGCDQAVSVSGPNAQFSQGHDVPFRLTVEGTASPDFSGGPCNVVNTESGAGTATHLGRVTWTSNEVANFCVNPNDPTEAEVTGNMIVTAANGDQLNISYVTELHADFGAGTLVISGDYDITGGTGRFAGATGSGSATASGEINPPFGVRGVFAGRIEY